MIWIIGEYANKIDNADELLGIFVDTFIEESYPVGFSKLCVVHGPNYVLRYNYKHSPPSSNSSSGNQTLHKDSYSRC